MDEPQILLDDGPLLGILKPAGLLTQGTPGGIPTVEGWVKAQLRQKYQKTGNVYLGIPHRLDRPVSGVMVFARNSKAAARLAEQFRERQVRKWYLCLVTGVPSESSGTLEDWLLKDAAAAHVTVVPPETPDARKAELRYEVVATEGERSLVRVELLTGRMHQIRVQFASRGWPIVGDLQYGSATEVPLPGAEPGFRHDVILLHAERLELRHPIRYDSVCLTAPPPAFWQSAGLWTGSLESHEAVLHQPGSQTSVLQQDSPMAAAVPEVGSKAPAFDLPAYPEGRYKLSQFKGKQNVVLYFYPKDDTPGCTTEACEFRDKIDTFEAADTLVLGVSCDNLDSHEKFGDKFDLPFPLLSDEDHAVAEKYGVWVEKNMYGRKSMGVQRATFLIDKQGKIAAVWPKVKVDGHVAAVAAALEEMNG